ncbi:hypothetical protein Pcinc_014582 [Petrolisthes cinctipes]|uniref:DDE Tnp4 domain-containing protein n=1 Tax=Petrolisthes cinctipes TaxID=88211 RepID=A0AAE1FUQ4_PETCI|nr:hypothetical protein Pcinc_014582 [Petrolisthes cinctipes]
MVVTSYPPTNNNKALLAVAAQEIRKDGKKSDDSLAPDFVPSVFSFTSSPRKRKAEVALQRFQRRQIFSKLKEDSKPSHEEAKGLTGKEVHEAGNCSNMENELPSESGSDTLSNTSGMLDYEQGANVALDKDCKYLREHNHPLNDNLSKLSLTENTSRNDEKVRFYTEIPAFTRGKKQLSMLETQDTREIASQRIHVERVIGLLRNKYTMLQDTHPLTMLQRDDSGLTCLDKCVRVACALVNMCPSVVPFD